MRNSATSLLYSIGGTTPLDFIFEEFVYYLQNKASLWIFLQMFQGTHKCQFYFSRDHGYEVTVKVCENQYFSCLHEY